MLPFFHLCTSWRHCPAFGLFRLTVLKTVSILSTPKKSHLQHIYSLTTRHSRRSSWGMSMQGVCSSMILPYMWLFCPELTPQNPHRFKWTCPNTCLQKYIYMLNSRSILYILICYSHCHWDYRLSGYKRKFWVEHRKWPCSRNKDSRFTKSMRGFGEG